MTRGPLLVCLLLLLPACGPGAGSPTPADSASSPTNEKPFHQEAIENVTGKTTVDQGLRAMRMIEKTSAERNKQLNEVLDR